MIDKHTYDMEYIIELKNKYKADPGLIERALYAFGLLEAIARSGMDFVFKGGSCLMLLLDRPARLSTDIDILVKPGTKIDEYIDKASKIFPFISKEEQIRKGVNNIEKRHFKFTYYSPVRKIDFYILLDVVFEEIPYTKVIEKPINNSLLLCTNDDWNVKVPSVDCILGDKLTAFAPHTTGIRLGVGKELEIAKQLFDVSILIDYIEEISTVKETYDRSAKAETEFRGEEWDKEIILKDTIRACRSIISRGVYDKVEYVEYLRGIKSLKNHILLPDYNVDDAVWRSCKVIYLAAVMLAGTDYKIINDSNEYSVLLLEDERFRKTSYVRKQNIEAYAYLYEAVKLLEGIEL